MITVEQRTKILNHFDQLPFWSEYRDEASIIVAGSITIGIDDEYADIDVQAFVDKYQYELLYEDYRKAIKGGAVSVLNPKALEFHEFPITLIQGLARQC